MRGYCCWYDLSIALLARLGSYWSLLIGSSEEVMQACMCRCNLEFLCSSKTSVLLLMFPSEYNRSVTLLLCHFINHSPRSCLQQSVQHITFLCVLIIRLSSGSIWTIGCQMLHGGSGKLWTMMTDMTAVTENLLKFVCCKNCESHLCMYLSHTD